jgi:uncharacterized membrane protein
MEEGDTMRIRDVTAAAIFAALTFVVTWYPLARIPIPATKGYFNLGEVVIYLAAIVFGPAVGAFAGAVGSALADIAAAAPQYAVFTFLIKGIEGYLVGRLVGITAASRLRATIVGGVWMVLGYFLAEVVFARVLGIAPTPATAVAAALTEVPWNIVQAAVGVVVAVSVAGRLRSAITGQAVR